MSTLNLSCLVHLISTKLRQILKIFKNNIGASFLGGVGFGGNLDQFGPSSRVTREGTFQSWHMQAHEHMKLIE
jgi:hypothetical protein